MNNITEVAFTTTVTVRETSWANDMAISGNGCSVDKRTIQQRNVLATKQDQPIRQLKCCAVESWCQLVGCGRIVIELSRMVHKHFNFNAALRGRECSCAAHNIVFRVPAYNYIKILLHN